MDLGSTQQSLLASCLSFPYQKLGRAMLSKKILKMDWFILVSFIEHVNIQHRCHLIQLSTSRLKIKGTFRFLAVISHQKAVQTVCCLVLFQNASLKEKYPQKIQSTRKSKVCFKKTLQKTYKLHQLSGNILLNQYAEQMLVKKGCFCLTIILSMEKNKMKKKCRKVTCEKETHIQPKIKDFPAIPKLPYLS